MKKRVELNEVSISRRRQCKSDLSIWEFWPEGKAWERAQLSDTYGEMADYDMMLFLKSYKKRIDHNIPPFPIISQSSSIGYNTYKYEDLMLGLRCPSGSRCFDLWSSWALCALCVAGSTYNLKSSTNNLHGLPLIAGGIYKMWNLLQMCTAFT